MPTKGAVVGFNVPRQHCDLSLCQRKGPHSTDVAVDGVFRLKHYRAVIAVDTHPDRKGGATRKISGLTQHDCLARAVGYIHDSHAGKGLLRNVVDDSVTID